MLTPIGTRALSRRQVVGLTVAVLAVELVIALPFLSVPPHDARGIPGPLLIVTSLTGAFFLGPVIGFGLTGAAVALAVLIVGENPLFEPVFWLPMSILIGEFGRRVRRGEQLRQELIEHLQSGLIALARQPVIGPVRVISRYLPAEREQLIAGDFYGVVLQPDGDLATLVADVAGHGPGAAAVATHLRAAWRALAVAGTPARAIVGILNETLEAEQRYSPGIKFATACVGSLSADGREACFVLAGHPPPILIADGTARPVAASPGPPMGLRRNGPWEAYNLHLPDPPWTLLLYTDGLIEGRAAPESVERYGPDRLAAAAAGLGAPLEEIDVEALLAAVRAANGRPMADDMVVLVLSAQAAARPMAPAVVERSG